MYTETLTWILPTTRADGSPLAVADIAQINLYDSANAPPTTPLKTITDPTILSFTTGALAPGAHSFTVEFVDSAGDISPPSNAVAVTVPLEPPSAGTLSGTLNGP